MTLLDHPIAVPTDGRQSPTALMVARGTQRLLVALGHSCVCELPLASGRRADLVALRHDGEIWIIEIKSSIEDFRVDQKWPEYRLHCDRLYFAIPPHVDAGIIPIEAGLIIADGWGAELRREPADQPLHASRRKAMILSFARTAALRLHGLYDPEAV